MTDFRPGPNSENFSRVLITGGAGFLGSHLAEHFLKQNLPIFCLDNFVCGTEDNYAYLAARYPKMQFERFDVTGDWSGLSSLAKFASQGLSHVFHLASPASPSQYSTFTLETMWTNSVGLGNALNFATHHGARLVFSSSSEVYGFSAPPQAEQDWGLVNSFGPRACYVEAKRFGEALVYHHNARFHTDHGIVRIFNTFGPRMSEEDGRVVLNLLRRAVAGETLEINGDGRQTRSFCYIDDLLAGLLLYAERPVTEPLNLGNDDQVSIMELASMVREITGRPGLPIEFLPGIVDEPVHRQPDLSRSLEMLAPWRPRVSLMEGLAQTLAWLPKSRPVAAEADKPDQTAAAHL